MVKISWLKEARDDLKDIFDYISRDSKKYAKRQVDKIILRTQILKKQIARNIYVNFLACGLLLEQFY